METQLVCQLCQEPTYNDRPSVQVGEKGCQGILAACSTRSVEMTITPGDFVHVLCRKNFTVPKTDKQFADISVEKHDKRLRSVAPNFDFKSRCLFCGTFAKCGKTNRKISFDTY